MKRRSWERKKATHLCRKVLEERNPSREESASARDEKGGRLLRQSPLVHHKHKRHFFFGTIFHTARREGRPSVC